MPPTLSPAEKARIEIDRQPEARGWQVQSREQRNLDTERGVAIRKFQLKTGCADYLDLQLSWRNYECS